jgi:hypothetical protein
MHGVGPTHRIFLGSLCGNTRNRGRKADPSFLIPALYEWGTIRPGHVGSSTSGEGALHVKLADSGFAERPRITLRAVAGSASRPREGAAYEAYGRLQGAPISPGILVRF